MLRVGAGAVVVSPRHSRARALHSLREVFEAITKAPIPPKRKYIVLDMTVEDDESDVIMPQVQFFFK